MARIDGLVGPSPFRKKKITVGASSTVAIDTLPLSLITGVKYFVAIKNVANAKYRSFEMNVMNANGTLKDIVSSKVISGSLNINVSAAISGTDMELQITNNEVFDLAVEFIRGGING